MARYFFEITYHGKNYHGWQSQHNAVGIQTVIEEALSRILREEIKIIGSGRTDTGVHCLQQFFHADITSSFDAVSLCHKLNSLLPRDIAIRKIRRVKPAANARHDALSRTYVYQITRTKEPLLTGLALHFFKPLDITAMQKAANVLKGNHDFRCFSKVKTDVNHFLCTVKEAKWKEAGTKLTFTITSNRFLRGMVRAIVGTLLDVGTGELTLDDFKKIISSQDRRNAGANVAPEGLYLVRVNYPASIFLK